MYDDFFVWIISQIHIWIIFQINNKLIQQTY